METLGGFGISRRNRLTPQEREKAKETLEILKAAETAQLALHPGHHDEVRQAFWYGVHQAREYGIALRSGDEDPFESALPTSDQVPVHEFRQALRISVLQGDLTEKQAEELTWEHVIQMLETNGQSLVGLSEEVLASKVYVPEAPRFFPTTEDDLADDFDHIRAAEERRRDATEEKTWETLKTHLEYIFQQASEDAERLHRRDSIHPLSSHPDFHGMATLLSRIPPRFRRQAFCLCLSGKREFMKTLVIASGDTSSPSIEASPVRVPMNVQAAKPQSGFWVLTWRGDSDGGWEFQLPESVDEAKDPKTTFDFDLGQLKESAAGGDVTAANFLSFVMWNSPEKVNEAWRSSNTTREAIRTDFTPKISHGSDPWADAVRMARTTFGWDLTADTVIKLMGLSKTGEYDELNASWKYPLSGVSLQPIAPRKLKDLFRKMGETGRSPASLGIEPLCPEILSEFARLIGVPLIRRS